MSGNQYSPSGHSDCTITALTSAWIQRDDTSTNNKFHAETTPIGMWDRTSDPYSAHTRSFMLSNNAVYVELTQTRIEWELPTLVPLTLGTQSPRSCIFLRWCPSRVLKEVMDPAVRLRACDPRADMKCERIEDSPPFSDLNEPVSELMVLPRASEPKDLRELSANLVSRLIFMDVLDMPDTNDASELRSSATEAALSSSSPSFLMPRCASLCEGITNNRDITTLQSRSFQSRHMQRAGQS